MSDNLDVLLGEPITATFGGRQWKLPADAPIPLVLKTQKLGALIQDDDADEQERADALTGLYDEILRLVQVHQPDADSVPLTTSQLVAFFPVVYGGASLEPQPDPTPPTPAAKTGSRSKKSRTTSRSSSK